MKEAMLCAIQCLASAVKVLVTAQKVTVMVVVVVVVVVVIIPEIITTGVLIEVKLLVVAMVETV